MIEIILLLLIGFAHCLAQQQLPLLPGVDDVGTGYDGTKMLSASEQRSRFRIFDLNDRRTSPFILKALGKEYHYALPTMVQVNDVSTRRENNCESVSYSFEQFYSR